MQSRYPAKTIKKIRKENLSEKTKYQLAKEMNICEKMVYYYTKDIPSKNPERTEIRGKTLDVLKMLLIEGYIDSDRTISNNLRTLQKLKKTICRRCNTYAKCGKDTLEWDIFLDCRVTFFKSFKKGRYFQSKINLFSYSFLIEQILFQVDSL